MAISGNTYAVIIGSSAYSVYSDLDTTNDYLAGDFDATLWRAETNDDNKGRAIISAARALDALSWLGTKADADQPLAWPRTGVGLDDIADDEIPQEITDANALLAKYIHNGTIKTSSSTTASNIRRQRAGSVEIEYFNPTLIADPSLFPEDVMNLIRRFLGGTALAGSIATGVDCPSAFRDGFGVSGPY